MIVNCPHCNGAVQLDTQYAGQTVSCPHCQCGIIVPTAEPTPEPAPVAAVPEEATASLPEPESTPEEPVEQSAPVEPPAESARPPTVRIDKASVAEPKGEPVEAKPGEALILFNCPDCGEELEVPESAIGEPCACPDCGIEVTDAVPRPKPQTGKKKIIMKKSK